MTKPRTFINCCLTLTLLATCYVAFSVPLMAANQLTVQCIDEAGAPLKGVQVTIFAVRVKAADQKKSNKKGLVVFKKVPTDLFRVWGRIEGYEPTFHEFTHMNEEDQKTVELQFKPGTDKLFYFEDATLAERATQLINEGLQARANGDSEAAIPKFEEALTITPTAIDALHNLGMAYLDLKRYEDTVAAMEAELEILALYELQGIDPGPVAQRKAEINNVIGFIPLLKIQGEAEEAFQAKDFNTAAAKFKEIAKVQPDNPGVYFNLATAQFNDQQFDEAMASINRALELDPENKQMATFKQTISQGKRGLLIQQSKAKISEFAGLYREKKYQEFVDAGQAASGEIVDELQPALWLDMARAYVQLEQVDNAVSAYGKVIEASPENLDVQEELARYLLEQGRTEDAIEAYATFYTNKGEPLVESLYAIGAGLGQKGKDDVAIHFYNKVLELDDQFAEVYYSLGMIAYFGQDHEKAEGILNKYLEIGKDAGHVDNAKSVLAVIEHSKKKK